MSINRREICDRYGILLYPHILKVLLSSSATSVIELVGTHSQTGGKTLYISCEWCDTCQSVVCDCACVRACVLLSASFARVCTNLRVCLVRVNEKAHIINHHLTTEVKWVASFS